MRCEPAVHLLPNARVAPSAFIEILVSVLPTSEDDLVVSPPPPHFWRKIKNGKPDPLAVRAFGIRSMHQICMVNRQFAGAQDDIAGTGFVKTGFYGAAGAKHIVPGVNFSVIQ